MGETEAAILRVLSTALDFILSRDEIIDTSGKTEDAVRSALYRMRRKGIVQNYLDGLVQKGYWKLVKLYRKIRHTKRIVETRQAKKKREWNCDCEATSEGYVLYTGYPAPPEIPKDSITRKFANVLNPKLRDTMIDILSGNEIRLFNDDRFTKFETTCNPIHFPVPKFCIDGTEWLDDLTGDSNMAKVHEVEVVFVNDTGVMYDKNHGAGIWTGTFEIDDGDFEF